MLIAHTAFSGFSVKDLEATKQFYTEVLGLKIVDETMGLHLQLPGEGTVFAYQKDDHEPAAFTILNFVVADIDEAISQLTAQKVTFEHYDMGNGAKTDAKGVMRGRAANMGPDIAWFKDPSGNILSIIQN